MSALRKARLQVTPLESREVPAGSVMNYSAGNFTGSSGPVNLAINFTGTNAISWNTAPPTMPAAAATGTSTLGGNLTVSLTGCGPNSAGTPGMQGNSIFINMNGNTLTGNLTVLTGPCNDRVVLINGTINGTVTISTNAGDDQVFVSAGTTGPITIGKSLTIAEAAGNDTVGTNGALTVGGNTGINMGAGNNAYNLAAQFNIGGNLQMIAGAGSDPIGQLSAGTSSIGGAAFFSPGNGPNQLILPCSLTIAGNTTYVGGQGTDDFTAAAMMGGNLLALLGAGNDTFSYAMPGCCGMVSGTAIIDGGPGIDVNNTPAACPITWPNTFLNIP
jgi:hypothetical protein